MHSFCQAASGNRVLYLLFRFSERYPVPLDDVAQKNKGKARRGHDSRTDTPGWIMASHADGGHALKMP